MVSEVTDMLTVATRLYSSPNPIRHSLLRFSSVSKFSPPNYLEESIKAVIKAKNYGEIANVLAASKGSYQNANPFSFLSAFPVKTRTNIVDEILQSFISLRPRSRPGFAYSCLLSYTLQSTNPLPLALAVLQCTLRSGCLPVPQTHVLLSTAWLECHRHAKSVSNILLGMQSIGYNPDCGICNYLILSLCKVDQIKEAIKVLKGMSGAGCFPDLDSYGTIICEMSELGRTADAIGMMKEMVATFNLSPRKEILVKIAAAFRANKETLRAVEMIEFLESKGVDVGFDVYDLVLEGCMECRQFVLAGKLVMRMTGKGFIPYIRVRQRVVAGLATVDEWKLASAVRQRFSDMNS